MVIYSRFLAISAIASSALAHLPDIGKRAPFDAVGMEKKREGFGSEPVVKDESQAVFVRAQTGKKNATMQQLNDRSLELVDRQSCEAGYWYCSAFGRCCPRSSNCCSYGYCIDPDDTCCPDGPCDPGWNCCGSNCSPQGGDCCSDGNHCEAGNICIRLGSSGRIVCCTDLDCTAVVVSGSTSYASTTLTESPPEITSPPTSHIITVGDSFTTWYWTVTWWYFSFYWSTFQAKSTVTFTRLYETTTFTTTATDESEASSLFFALSQTLSFTPPADAQTSLASLINVLPSETESFSFEDPFSNGFPGIRTGSTARSTSTRATTMDNTQGPVGPPGGASMGNGNLVSLAMVAIGTISGISIIWL